MSWIKLHRNLMNNPLWQDKPFARGQAWVDLLLLANGVDKQEMKKGRIVHYERGKVYRSVLELAARWGWSRKKTTSFLKMLEAERMVCLETSKRGSMIRVINWTVYQEENSKKGTTEDTTKPQTDSGFAADWGTTEEQQRNNRGATEEQQRNIKKNVKENIETPTNQLTTGKLVSGSGENVGRCVGGEGSAVPSAGMPGAVPSARDADTSEDRYRYGEAIALYEKIKGAPMSPNELEKLMGLVDDYGTGWVMDALKIAGQTEGCRSRINYAQGILRNWKSDGRDSVPELMTEEERLAAIVRAMEEAKQLG